MASTGGSGTAGKRSAGGAKTTKRARPATAKATTAKATGARATGAKATAAKTKGPEKSGQPDPGSATPEAAALAQLTAALVAARDGDFKTRVPVRGPGAEAAAAFNELAARNEHLAKELERVRRVVGREGRLSERLAARAG